MTMATSMVASPGAGLLTTYLFVEYEENQYTLVFSPDHFSLQPSEGGATYLTIPWAKVVKQQVLYPRPRLKIVLDDGRNPMFRFQSRKELERARNDVALRLNPKKPKNINKKTDKANKKSPTKASITKRSRQSKRNASALTNGTKTKSAVPAVTTKTAAGTGAATSTGAVSRLYNYKFSMEDEYLPYVRDNETVSDSDSEYWKSAHGKLPLIPPVNRLLQLNVYSSLAFLLGSFFIVLISIVVFAINGSMGASPPPTDDPLPPPKIPFNETTFVIAETFSTNDVLEETVEDEDGSLELQRMIAIPLLYLGLSLLFLHCISEIYIEGRWASRTVIHGRFYTDSCLNWINAIAFLVGVICDIILFSLLLFVDEERRQVMLTWTNDGIHGSIIQLLFSVASFAWFLTGVATLWGRPCFCSSHEDFWLDNFGSGLYLLSVLVLLFTTLAVVWTPDGGDTSELSLVIALFFKVTVSYSIWLGAGTLWTISDLLRQKRMQETAATRDERLALMG